MVVFATLVVYDISDDKLRTRIEKICKKYGLSHIQRSLFVGFISEEMRKHLFVEILNAIEANRTGSICIRIYRVRSTDYKYTLKIGTLEGYDEDPKPEEAYFA